MCKEGKRGYVYLERSYLPLNPPILHGNKKVVADFPPIFSAAMAHPYSLLGRRTIY